METYYWKTEKSHFTNAETTDDFMDNHLPEHFEIILFEAGYLEIKNKNTGELFEVHVSGNGDFCNHKAEFKSFEH